MKPISEFHRQSDRSDGAQRHCKECSKELIRAAWRDPAKRTRQAFCTWRHNIKRLYGMSPEDYNLILQQQGGRCGICQRTLEEAGHKQQWMHFNIDHDDATGVVRGLLCGPCNRGIGSLKHNIALLEAAIRYLQNQPPNLTPPLLKT